MNVPAGLLTAAYAPLLALSDRLVGGTPADAPDVAADAPDVVTGAPDVEAVGWTATALPGWTVRDLLFHLASDAQRALVALHTPAGRRPDTDEIGYWSRWTPGSESARTGLRATRTMAAQWSSVRGPATLHATTARAVLHAVSAADPDAAVHTQGHVLTVRALVSTLAVEAAVHQLDLVAVVAEPPAPEVLTEVRRVCDALLGHPAPPAWDDVRWARLATGRAAPTVAERQALGDAATRLPLFG